MSCRFKGSFTSDEKERLEKTARAVERLLSREARGQPAWAFLHFEVPYAGYSYWGVRYEDGLQVGAETAEGLATSLSKLRIERLRQQERLKRSAMPRGADRPTASFEASAS